MTNAELMTKHDAQEEMRTSILSFEFRHSFVIRHSSFVISANRPFAFPKPRYY